ncbi:AAA family ATPase [Bacillus badius]|uniref:AAA family ATPase n=1 Tax=Bacillus badius TaxID=1455 RepID=UPI0007B0AD8C|nr:AAA family ATPase [Bacillus badius]KZN98399.1 AAA family ATPase [Bacillus badius]MED0666890.1 AAA family ATPase [Bacillus badius]OCS82766.1 AAA family ATPase [Bacillus badius]OVE51472.1 AAA family ATPase [Bacillus badius]TDW02586.1 putative ATPase [Bacillus badius]
MTNHDSSPFIKQVRFKKEAIPSFDTYPFHFPFIWAEAIDLHPKITYIIGENGMGKSTLLEAIALAAGFNPEGGTFHFNFSTYQSHSELEHYIKLIKGTRRPKDGFFLRAETFYNVATNIEELDKEPGMGPRIIDGFGGKPLHEQSHGESFFAAFNHRFRGNGLYILDEPEAALSPLRQLSILSRMHDLLAENSQFIIATHSPLLMAYPDAAIWELTEEGLRERSLEETGHYKIMKQFFEDKERLLHHLLSGK